MGRIRVRLPRNLGLVAARCDNGCRAERRDAANDGRESNGYQKFVAQSGPHFQKRDAFG
jgi:hypothetical protein